MDIQYEAIHNVNLAMGVHTVSQTTNFEPRLVSEFAGRSDETKEEPQSCYPDKLALLRYFCLQSQRDGYAEAMH